MKRKLIHRNKTRISKRFIKEVSDNGAILFDVRQITYDSINRSKQFGQRCHQTRLVRQQKMNPRQLKKLRKRQQRLGLVGSKYGGICQLKLRAAAARFFKEN